MNMMLEWALKYRLHGRSIFPVGPDKKPLVAWKEFQGRLATEDEIRKWFDVENPPNIGMVTGKISGITVIDVENGGDWPIFPPTLTAKTGRGGRHLFYKWAPNVQNATRVLPLTDIRGEGGYVVVSPSINETGGKYEWVNVINMQPFPYELVKVKPEQKEKADWSNLLQGVPAGGRNATAARVLGKMLNVSLFSEWGTTVWEMFCLWNMRNTPPMHERELRTIFNSIVNKRVRAGEIPKDDSTDDVEIGIKLISEIAKDLTDDIKISYPTGYKTIDDSFMGGIKEGDLWFVTGQTGFGKCHGLGTKILMYDGTIKNVEDVKVGDLVMGDDSTPRKVKKLARGVDEMFEVTQVKGEKYTVNSQHILSLRCGANASSVLTKGKLIDMPVKEYIKQSGYFKHMVKGYKASVDFKEQNTELSFDPYTLGYWLGNGHSKEFSITTMDVEVVKHLYMKFGKVKGHHIRTHQKENNKATTFAVSRKRCPDGFHGVKPIFHQRLKDLSLIDNKHIPHVYKTSSKKDRLLLLAGLIDSDGYTAGPNGYTFVNKNERLAMDVCFVARSLGFCCSVKRFSSHDQNGTYGEYWKIGISGDCSIIPVKVERKKIKTKRKQIKNVLNTGISIKSIGRGNYYGFETDGNHRYLLGDFTVTHNSTIAQSMTYNLDSQGLTTMWFSFEMPLGEIWRKFKDMGVTDNFKAYAPEKIVSNKIGWLKEMMLKAKDAYNIKFFFIDHLGFLSPEMKGYDTNMSNNYSTVLTMICRELKTLAIQENVAVILLGHMRKPPAGYNQEPTIFDIKDSGGVAQEADAVIILNRERADKNGGQDLFREETNVRIEKNRRTGKLKNFYVKMDKGRLVETDGFERLEKTIRETSVKKNDAPFGSFNHKD